MRNLTITLVIVILSFGAHGQRCNTTTQQEFIHANNIRAMVLNGGDNFWDLDDAQFTVPYNGQGSPSSIFATALWLGAMDKNDQLRVSTVSYRSVRNCGYEAGPIFDDPNRPFDIDYENWDKIFSVHQSDILAHQEDFDDGVVDNPIDAIFGWPALGNKHFEGIHGFPLELTISGAGFHELPNSINGIYEPELGEYPHVDGMSPEALPGEIKWCVYNNHAEGSSPTSTDPLSFEIQQTMYAMSCPNEALSNSLFVRYKLINKSGQDYKDLKLGQWMDPDLGCYTDDYIGCDPRSNSAYSYNVDEVDGEVGNTCNGKIATYPHPPISSLTFLNVNLDKFGYYNNSAFASLPPAQTDPTTPIEYYHFMNGSWRDGTRMTRGGVGYNPQSNDFVDHVFPDDPTDINGWSMGQLDLPVGDTRFIASSHKSTFMDQEVLTVDMVFAYYNDGVSSAWGMVSGALENIKEIQELYNSGFSECLPEQCNCECVWPGDTDKDGEVTYLDNINIIRAISQSGIERPNGLAWKGYDVDDWSFNLPDGTNAKHSDLNGDGEVTQLDLDFLDDYIERKNLCLQEKELNCPEGNDIRIEHRFNDSLFHSGGGAGPMRIFFYPKEEFEGITYEVQFDKELFEHLSLKGELEFPDKQSQIFKGYDIIDGNSRMVQIIQMSTTKNDQKLNDSRIADIVIRKKEPPVKYPTPYAEIKICNAVMHKADGSKIPLKSQSYKFWFDDSVITSTMSSGQSIRFDLFPNPANQTVYLKSSELEGEVRLLDNLGRVISSKKLNGQTNILDVSNLDAGIYFVQIWNDGKSGIKKLIIAGN